MSVKKALTLSIVIPAYNEENYLEACLEQVAAQTVPPDEVIVVDNNSTDKTATIARRFPFVRLLTEAEPGVLYARNKGFDAAKSEIIARIDADTRLPIDWVAIVKAGFARHPHDALTGPVSYYDMPWPRTNHKLDMFFRSRIYKYYHHLPALFGTNMAMRRSDWQKVAPLTCHRRDMFEDVDLAIHLNGIGVHSRYYPDMLAAMSARRYDDSLPSFHRYLTLYDKTYDQHGYKSLMPRVARTIYVVFYIFMWPFRRAYDETAGRRTWRQFWHGHTHRKHPMDEA